MPVPPLNGQRPPIAQANEAREAQRAQIVDALLRQVAALQDPGNSAEGACTLPAPPSTHLACNNDALLQALSAQAPVLTGLLQAYRSMDPQADGLSIAYAHGRYRLSPDAARDTTVASP